MKKLLLIPTVLIAGVTPIISLVGCNQIKTFNLDYYKTITYHDWVFPILTMENSVSLDANVAYQAKIDTKKFQTEIVDNNLWNFSVSQNVLTDDEIDAQFSNASVKIDNKPLEFYGHITSTEELSYMSANQFAILQNEDASEIITTVGSFDNNSIIEINFEIKEAVRDFFLAFVVDALGEI